MEQNEQLMQKKYLHRRFSTVGWILLIYYGIMNLSVFLETAVEVIIQLARTSGDSSEDFLKAAMETAGSAWGYFLAAGIGLIILLCWKKPCFWKNDIWARGKPMTGSSFFALLCIFLSGQAVFQVLAIVTELVLNFFGLSIMEGLNAAALDTDRLSMFLYAGILAPISEEILFRGLIQRSLMPYGKKFAIFCSAFVFGLFHGSMLQSVYAFLVGFVLGFVAAEYSIAWSMVLHMINNLVIADVVNRLTMGLPETAAGLISWGITVFFAVAAIVIVTMRRGEIRAYLSRERIAAGRISCFFSSAGMIILMIVMGISMVLSMVVMISPL